MFLNEISDYHLPREDVSVIWDKHVLDNQVNKKAAAIRIGVFNHTDTCTTTSLQCCVTALPQGTIINKNMIFEDLVHNFQAGTPNLV